MTRRRADMSDLTERGVCFDLLEFLKGQRHVLGFTEEDVNNMYEELRMGDTRDLHALTDERYLDDITCLDEDQKRRLWILVQAVQADGRYSLDSDSAQWEHWSAEKVHAAERENSSVDEVDTAAWKKWEKSSAEKVDTPPASPRVTEETPDDRAASGVKVVEWLKNSRDVCLLLQQLHAMK